MAEGWGIFFCGYQEGDLMPKAENEGTTELAKVFGSNGIDFEVMDITEECYELLKRKREAALSLPLSQGVVNHILDNGFFHPDIETQHADEGEVRELLSLLVIFYFLKGFSGFF